MSGQATLSQVEKMTTQPIPKLITTLAVPTIISMLITSIYNMADTFFVSRLGTSATGAVGIVFSLMAIIQAVGFTLGIGSGSLISRLLGAREHEEAEKIASTGFFAAIAFGLALTVFGLIFIDPLMASLGATKTILPYARDYAKYILLGAAIMSSSFVLNNVLRSEGKATLAMVGITAGGLLNIVLDPIFIFTFHLGIAGAAIATILSQIISFLILLGCFLTHKSLLHLSFRNISWKWKDLSAIIKTGLPSFFRQGLASIATVMLNVNAAVYGDAAVAAMSVVGKVFMLILSVLIGFGQGYQPVVGFNYGAGCYKRVKQSFTFTTIVSFVMMGILAVAGFIFAPQVIQLFTKADAQVLEIGTYAMRAQCLALFIQPLGVIANMTFQSIGKPAEATFLSACRQGVFFLPLILILPQLWQLRGVELTQPLADVLTFVVCFPFLFKFFNDLNQKIVKQEGE
ncbi:MATE family efflux transporter [Holdemania sp. Marseille-P2844]|uniref:MATE family efflux transporter n=1 Tax=Holdemania sp. Marseille-P2844 TaxID=1852366 RepID=UPI000932C149|nr:MATE family efflux transporter [Holdemania sp. Marseille-P2844]